MGVTALDKPGVQLEPVPFVAVFEVYKVELQVKGDKPRSGDFILEAYTATDDLDLQGDKITPEALRLLAKDLLKNSTVLENHDEDRRVAKILAAEEREGRLWVQMRVSETVPDIRKQIEEGILNKLSIRGKVTDWIRNIDFNTGKSFRLIKRLLGLESSLVSLPANTEVRTIRWYIQKAMKEDSQMPDPKDKKDDKTDAPQVTKGEDPKPGEGDQATPPADPPKTDPPATPPADPPADPPKADAPEAAKAVDDAVQKAVDTRLEAMEEAAKAHMGPFPVPGNPSDKPGSASALGAARLMATIDQGLGMADGDLKRVLQMIKAMVGRMTGAAPSYPFPEPVAKVDSAGDKKPDATVTPNPSDQGDKKPEPTSKSQDGDQPNKGGESTDIPDDQATKFLGDVVDAVKKVAGKAWRDHPIQMTMRKSLIGQSSRETTTEKKSGSEMFDKIRAVLTPTPKS